MFAMMSFRQTVVEAEPFIEISQEQLAQIVTELSPKVPPKGKPIEYDDRLQFLADREPTEYQASRRKPFDIASAPLSGRLRQLSNFEFNSLDEVTSNEWSAIHRRLTGHVKKMLWSYQISGANPNNITSRLINSVRSGELAWNQMLEPNLLSFLFDSATSVVIGALDLPETQRRHRKRGSGITKRITADLDVKEIIQHLPQIALIVSRLNDLLNPVANPGSVEGGDR